MLKILRQYNHMKLLCFVDSRFSDCGCDTRWGQPHVGNHKNPATGERFWPDHTQKVNARSNPWSAQCVSGCIDPGWDFPETLVLRAPCMHRVRHHTAITNLLRSLGSDRRDRVLWTAAFALCMQSLLLFQKHNGFITAKKDLLDLPMSLLSVHVSN